MDYLIDGYNLMFSTQEQKHRSFEEARQALIDLLNESLSVIKTHVTLVFDSSEQIRDFAQKASLRSLDVVYAPKGLTADQYIIELVEHARRPKTLTVVTSDSGLALQCQHLGASTQSIDEFLSFVEKKNKAKGSAKPHYIDNPDQIERLRKIFEKKFNP